MLSLENFAALSLTMRLPNVKKRPWRTSLCDVDAEYRAFTEAGGCGWTVDGLFHFFGPDGPAAHELESWNRKDIWRSAYLGPDSDWVSFAEDVFGNQFLLKGKGSYRAVRMLSLWTGATRVIAGRFGDFVRDVIVDEETWGGQRSLFLEITAQAGMYWRPLHHLSPIVPVLLGGSGDRPENFEWCEALANVSVHAQIVKQTAPRG